MAAAESGIRLVERCQTCGYLTYSACNNTEQIIDVTEWDGSDFFIVWPLPKCIFITDRVAQTIVSNR